MPSGSSGRYQSRIFNFVHQQSRRLTEQVEHTIRYVQVATKWGVEVLLYPVYLWLHSSQSSERTLDGQPNQPKLQLEPQTPPDADTPIVNVLETVKNLPFADATTTPSNDRLSSVNPLGFRELFREKIFKSKSTANSSLVKSITTPENSVRSLNPVPMYPIVRGIATNLAKRNLLLVTADNETLDILTPQQQAKLEDKIISEVADYWRAWRLLKVKKQTSPLPEIERLLAKLTVSNSEQTPALTPGKVNEEVNKSQDLLNYQKTLTFLDAALANLESKAIVPIQQRSQEIIQIAQTQFNIFLYGKEELAARGKITATSDELENQGFNLEAVIAAALNYFLGVDSSKKLETSNTEIKSPGKRLAHRPAPKSIISQSENQDVNADTWLSWNDLYGESETTVKTPQQALSSTSSARTSVPKNSVKNYQNSLPKTQLDADLTQKKKSSPNLSRTQKKSGKVTSNKQTNSSINQPSSNSKANTQIEAKPDWIETKATFMGYEKHFLEKVFELLDSIMVWLETIFVNMMMFLRGLLRVK
ncbi:hypothetical protein NIES2100_53440 [Calothrix sp. NIES-2100]|uniref:hypothetical protein n=1 Tax=Calothrix sp. NIES-2100 TaxID=1954172 RepID=UPI000B5EA3B8|nr:hypothetical protein NIES2100_53440 [Calothrix sp. NIES-2100]